MTTETDPNDVLGLNLRKRFDIYEQQLRLTKIEAATDLTTCINIYRNAEANKDLLAMTAANKKIHSLASTPPENLEAFHAIKDIACLEFIISNTDDLTILWNVFNATLNDKYAEIHVRTLEKILHISTDDLWEIYKKISERDFLALETIFNIIIETTIVEDQLKNVANIAWKYAKNEHSKADMKFARSMREKVLLKILVITTDPKVCNSIYEEEPAYNTIIALAALNRLIDITFDIYDCFWVYEKAYQKDLENKAKAKTHELIIQKLNSEDSVNNCWTLYHYQGSQINHDTEECILSRIVQITENPADLLNVLEHTKSQGTRQIATEKLDRVLPPLQ